jgi:DNA-directed RNA polymerase subunit M/transcription elongation factor TFIIS
MITTADTFKYQCSKCVSFEIPSNKDTLVYEDVIGTNLTIYKAILHNAGKDPVNPKVRRHCKCGNQFAKQVRLGHEMKLINTCTTCGNQWLDGTHETDFNADSSEITSKPSK